MKECGLEGRVSAADFPGVENPIVTQKALDEKILELIDRLKPYTAAELAYDVVPPQ